MSKNKKRKKNVPDRKSVVSHLVITKTYYDDFVKTARKFMLLVGLESSAFDALSKRTKMYIMRMKHAPYRVSTDKDHKVPRAFVRLFQTAMVKYQKTTYYGDPAFQITFLEYVTTGLTLIFFFRNCDNHADSLQSDQMSLLHRIREPLLKYVKENEEEHYAVRVNEAMKTLLLHITQPHYRYYTSKEAGVINQSKCRMDNLITVSSIDPERKTFMIDGANRSAYRLGYYHLASEAGDVMPIMADIPIRFLEEENVRTMKLMMNQIKTAITVPVYIQLHALRRLAERLDTKNLMYRNIIFSLSFCAPMVVTAMNGQRLITARGFTGKPVGYFPFVKQDGAVLLLSFIPLSSPITPQGSVLYRELGIEMEDSNYIGLDKLSFYCKTDFDAVPKLKQALIRADMWHLTEIEPDVAIERKADLILNGLFANLSENE